MNSQQRVLLALNKKEIDKIPWIEIYFDNNVASEILGKVWRS